MSVMASGRVDIKTKQPIPEEIIELTRKKYLPVTQNNHGYYADFDGNWRLDEVISALEPLNPYVKEGTIDYWSDEGEAYAKFDPEFGIWDEEWQEHFYYSELPTSEISSNERVAEILDVITSDLIDGSDASAAVELLFNKCKLTDNEIRYYGLEWLKDLR